MINTLLPFKKFNLNVLFDFLIIEILQYKNVYLSIVIRTKLKKLDIDNKLLLFY